MEELPSNRRKDSQLREAIDRFHRDIQSFSDLSKVYHYTLKEICALSGSPFAFAMERCIDADGQTALKCIAAHLSVADAEPGADVNIEDWPLIRVEQATRALYNAISFNRPMVLDPDTLRSLRSNYPKLPLLEQVLVLTLNDGQKTRSVICLANAQQPYHVDFAKRIWPLLTTCVSLMRIIENKQLQSISEKRVLLEQDSWRESFGRLETLAPVGIITINREQKILRINPAAELMFGRIAAQAVHCHISDLLPERFRNEHSTQTFNAQSVKHGHKEAIRVQGCKSNGQIIPLELSLMFFEEYRQPRIMLILRDSSRLIEIQEQHQAELQRFKVVADLAPMGILQTDTNWNTEYANDRWLEITGMTRESVEGMSWSKFLHHEDAEPVLTELHSQVGAGQEFRKECRVQRGIDDVVWVWVQARPLFTLNGEVNGFVATMVDNSYHHDAEEKLRHLAERDVLTGLANRMLFFDRLEHALQRVERHGALAILALDLDGFKNINDTLGHDAGDRMLVEVANRLLSCVRQEDTVSRVGGDEFFILLESLSDASVAAHVSDKILKALEMPFTIAQQEVFISTSIGICFAVNGQSSSSKTLLKQADMALYRAKDSGRNNYQYYSPDLERASRRKLELGNSLHRALGRAEFEVFYQAQATVASNKIIGFEALLRWRHPVKGLLGPDSFIGLLEDTGLIAPVSRWLLHISFHQLKDLIALGMVDSDAVMSVNISPRQFRDPLLLLGIEKALSDSGLSGKNVVVEITESALIQDQGHAVDSLKKIREMGIKVALDDFGTGFSSLSYLKKYPIDIIKIDRSFIKDLLIDKEDEAITQAVLALGRSLKMEVIAEGVETFEILNLLKLWGCDTYQGYLLNKPIAGAEIANYFSKQLQSRRSEIG
ncbi:sensor domain-containing protein [Teredinibacter waterburyi]|uniref:sensor domain-containing protein n=1 Tax=Teredinibacter waterburyi TaxID=1500538 RepID=UPI00165FD99D|nr:EAL domain-containing protein [Teredinibacter waterburyi]